VEGVREKCIKGLVGHLNLRDHLKDPGLDDNTGYTQKNGAVSLYSPLKPHHSFVYTLYNNKMKFKDPERKIHTWSYMAQDRESIRGFVNMVL
jgi:hypothetical protein